LFQRPLLQHLNRQELIHPSALFFAVHIVPPYLENGLKTVDVSPEQIILQGYKSFYPDCNDYFTSGAYYYRDSITKKRIRGTPCFNVFRDIPDEFVYIYKPKSIKEIKFLKSSISWLRKKFGIAKKPYIE
jgi:hypothetical protein